MLAVGSVPTIISDNILAFLESDNVPWVFSNGGVVDVDSYGYYDSPQFTHTLVEDGTQYAEFQTDIHALWKFVFKSNPKIFNDFKELTRVKCNMVTRGATNTVPHVPHVDRYTPHTVLIYYVNDADGDTIVFEDNKEVCISPEKGKYIIFDGKYKHCGTSPTLSNHRLVINFNF